MPEANVEVTDIVTLERLAGEGRYWDVKKNLPTDIHTAKLRIKKDGKVMMDASDPDFEPLFCPTQLYADEKGWMVGFLPNKLGAEITVFGHIEVERVNG